MCWAGADQCERHGNDSLAARGAAKARQALGVGGPKAEVPPGTAWHRAWKVSTCRTGGGMRLFMITNTATLFTLFAERTPPCGAEEGLRRITKRIEACLKQYGLPSPAPGGAAGVEFVRVPNASLTGVMNQFAFDLECYEEGELDVLEACVNRTPVLTWGFPDRLFQARLAGGPQELKS